MRKSWFILLFALALFVTAPVQAEEWEHRGARARAMGGAQVAISQGTLSAYWNPAAYAFGAKSSTDEEEESGLSGLTIQFLVGDVGINLVTTEELAQDIEDLRDLVDAINDNGGVDGLSNRLTSTPPSANQQDINNLAQVFDLIGRFEGSENNRSLYLTTHISALDLRIGMFGLSSSATIFGGINPQAQSTLNNIIGSVNGAANSFGVVPTNLYGVTADKTPSTPAGQSLANTLSSTAGTSMSQAQANHLVASAEESGVDVSDPLFQAALISAVENTANGGTGNLSENQSGVRIQGITLVEVRATAAFALLPDILAVGGNLKIMHGVTFSRFIDVSDFEDADEIYRETLDDLDEQSEEDVQFSVDAAVLFKFAFLRLGLVGRNLIPTSYSSKTGSSIQINPQVRAGAAVVLMDGALTVAVDADVTKNRSDVADNLKSNIVSAGVEFKPINLPFVQLAVRAGIYRNTARDEIETWTAGLGVYVGPVVFEASAEADSESIKDANFSSDFNDNDIPERLGFSMTLYVNLTF